MINNVNETLIGKKVRFVGKSAGEFYELFAPDYGTIGTITDVCGGDMEVEWPKGSVVNDGAFWYTKNELELVEEMTNEEIWEMLKPKMEKNGFLDKAFEVCFIDRACEHNVNKKEVFLKKDVCEAIALAYKVGYLRSQKGRPFKIGEKKKKGGHWVPVDPDNLPKEGTRVRYTRERREYKNCSNKITLGSTGIVRLKGPEHNWFGMSLDDYEGIYYNWFSFDGLTAKSLDMWVEDDE